MYDEYTPHHGRIDQCLQELGVNGTVLKYWIKSTCRVETLLKNEAGGEQDALGIVLQGQFRIDQRIPIKKSGGEALIRKFEISLLGGGEVFTGSVTCESARGMVMVLPRHYI